MKQGQSDSAPQYEFDIAPDRRDTWSWKWKVSPGELPMWVADMDFEVAPEIVADLKARLNCAAYGYTYVPDEWYKAYISWWSRRHSLTVAKEEIFFVTGVVPLISSAVRRLTHPNENVVLQTPVYNVFFNCVVNNGCRVLTNRLFYDGHAWQMDFRDLEEKLKDPQTTLMILCNPQNPCGRIWTKNELARVGELCARYHVTVISDEIHCDVHSPESSYVPFASASDICRKISISCWSPSKAFNLAGMQSAAGFIPNPRLRTQIVRGLNNDEVAEPNFMAVTAAVSAFEKGERWLDELNRYVSGNKNYCMQFMESHMPHLHVFQSDATYLLWIDATSLCPASEHAGFADVAAYIRNRTGLFLSCGEQYGEGLSGFVRLNVATPRVFVEEAMHRLETLAK